MKKLAAFLIAIVMVVALSSKAKADDISFAGSVLVSQGGNAINPAVNFTFSGLTVTSLGGDSLNGTAVSITPNTAFSFTSISGDAGLFSPNTGTLTMGNATTGILTGQIDFVMIVQGPTFGNLNSFVIQVALSNISITGGTSALLSSMVTTGANGDGVLTFQFTAGPTTSLNDLLHLGTGVGQLGTHGPIGTSVSGTIGVPEPASLALLGTGLLMGSGFIRRKFAKA